MSTNPHSHDPKFGGKPSRRVEVEIFLEVRRNWRAWRKSIGKKPRNPYTDGNLSSGYFEPVQSIQGTWSYELTMLSAVLEIFQFKLIKSLNQHVTGGTQWKTPPRFDKMEVISLAVDETWLAEVRRSLSTGINHQKYGTLSQPILILNKKKVRVRSQPNPPDAHLHCSTGSRGRKRAVSHKSKV